MSAEALPGGRSPARHRATGRRAARGRDRASAAAASRFVRLAVAGFLLACAIVVPSQDQRIRDAEAWLASHVIAMLGVPTGFLGGSASMAWFALSPKFRIGLIVTPDCTVALLTIPFLVAGALLIWLRAPVWRTAGGIALAVVSLELLNQARLFMIAAMTRFIGYPTGFYWGHTLFGSVLLVLGLTAILTFFAILVLRRGTAGR
jgi:exosortase/archaeosortase family protein